MEGSGNGGVTAVLSAVIYSPSPGFYPFTAWNQQLGLLLLSAGLSDIMYGTTVTGMVNGVLK